MYFTIYKTTNLINEKYYIGKHKTNTLTDSYMGSGVAIKAAIRKYGIKNFKKEILFVFNTEEEMNNKEKELVVIAENSYNMTEGGKGGFSYIQKHGLNAGANNVMHNVDVKLRNIAASKITRDNNKEFYDSVSRNNLKAAVAVNTGKSRPEHAKIMSIHFKKRWEDKEQFRDNLSSWFEVVSPNAEVFKTNRLEEFCKARNLGYGALWNTSRTNKPVSKGKAKGWICKKMI